MKNINHIGNHEPRRNKSRGFILNGLEGDLYSIQSCLRYGGGGEMEETLGGLEKDQCL